MLLRYFSDLCPTTIAKNQKLSTETVKTRLKRSLSLLRDRLKSHWGDDVDSGVERWQAALLFLVDPSAGAGLGISLEVSAASSTATSAGSSSLLLGALLMTKKTLLTAGALFLLIHGLFGAWKLFDHDPPDEPVKTRTTTARDAHPRNFSLADSKKRAEPSLSNGSDKIPPDLQPDRTTSAIDDPLLSNPPKAEPVGNGITGRVLDAENNVVADAVVLLIDTEETSYSRKSDFVRRLPDLMDDRSWGVSQGKGRYRTASGRDRATR